MKSAYELAMERLEESSPQAKISDEQKAEIAAIDEKFRAKMAEREVFLADLLMKARMEGNYHEMTQLETQKAREIASLKADCEAAKEKVRASQ
ncbi:MAG: hypothetical protein P1U86_07280 [Verrucomicrobiales bacterium]|nr:hypothetical protein [Verrucomicrobiales bacterium]